MREPASAFGCDIKMMKRVHFFTIQSERKFGNRKQQLVSQFLKTKNDLVMNRADHFSFTFYMRFPEKENAQAYRKMVMRPVFPE